MACVNNKQKLLHLLEQQELFEHVSVNIHSQTEATGSEIRSQIEQE